jgi:predicted AlkP superfamily pyrophosphatase or phosphodiesterase
MMILNKYILAFAFAAVSTLTNAQDTTQKIIPNRVNSVAQQTKPYVILISADGFRYDLAKKYHATNLLRLSQAGVAAAYLQPSYPSLTFPNHYTIITGLYPAHHGLVDNSFYDEQKTAIYTMSNKKEVADSSWYGGTPLWVLAEQQQMLSASFYWVASESAIHGIRPTYYYIYNEKIDINTRIRTVKSWLQLPAGKRPHFISFYFPEVDHAEHMYGPDSKQAEEAVHFIDESIGKMVAAIDSLHLPVNFIFVADHGMTVVDSKQTLPLPSAIDSNKFIIPYGDALVHLYAKNRADIQPTYDALKRQAVDFDVYLTDKMPKRWHYSKSDDIFNRIGDIILVPKLPKIFNLGNRPTTPGKHGFDPFLTDMHASFYAWGPAFRRHVVMNGFENIHVYPLVAAILGLPYHFQIDGKLRILKPVLKD